MSTVKDIEEAIEALPRPDLYRLRDWMQQHLGDEWDREFEEDALTGKLDALANQALAEHRAGSSSPFPPHEEPCHP